MKAIHILLTAALLTALQTVAHAEPDSGFAVKTPPAPKPKTQTMHVSILDQGIDYQTRSYMLRADFRHLYPTDDANQNGVVFSGNFHHLFVTHPALLNRHVEAKDAGLYPNYNELGLGAGYRWAYENFALIPQAHFRNQFAFGQNVNQHLIGFEPGLRLEYWLYPEVARFSVDYGFNVPFLHLANQNSSISPFQLSLHRISTELSYRLFENIDVVAGFYWWQVPSQLGTGSINHNVLLNMTGFQIGGGFAF